MRIEMRTKFESPVNIATQMIRIRVLKSRPSQRMPLADDEV
jgi:hypothetical protein